jgi:hypothetical protein
MADRLRLDDCKYEPTKEELLEKAAEKCGHKLFTIDVELDDDTVLVDCYPDCELRNVDAPMRVQVAYGMSQGEFLFYLRKIEEEARNNWNRFLTTVLLSNQAAERGEDIS